MMKRMVRLVLFACCVWPAYAGYDDGLISPGEYEWQVDWSSGTLIVDGGGAYRIEARSFSQIEVQSTSSPLGTGAGGIIDLKLFNYSRLDYYGGETDELTIGNSAKAYLHGGRIDGISSAQHGDPHIFIYARERWDWKYEDGAIRGITGLWWDGTDFNIRFTTKFEPSGYPPVWKNIDVITPEPATLLLIGLGSLLLRRRAITRLT